MDTIPIIFSTVTGNAVKLALAAAEAVPDHIGPYNIRYVTGAGGGRGIHYVTDAVVNDYDTLILAYWCDLGSADEDTLALIAGLKNKRLILLGTLGAPADGAHAKKVAETVEKIASRDNILLGSYLCRGSIDLHRTESKRKIPEGQKGRLDDAGYARHLQSQGHPDESDLEGARRAVRAALEKTGDK
ncbi:MAG: flavodoxin family protein [Clostridiales bacterium]|jgi:hypothetical protein|nr:flavodoxin family protein [Clostridiales bacterium]